MFTVITPVENVKTSLMFKEGTVIARYNHGGLVVELVTTGSPIVEYQGCTYDDVQDFPPELMYLIKSGRKKEVNVIYGNKYEILISRDNQYLDNEVLPDISGYSNRKLEQLMAQTAMDYAF